VDLVRWLSARSQEQEEQSRDLLRIINSSTFLKSGVQERSFRAPYFQFERFPSEENDFFRHQTLRFQTVFQKDPITSYLIFTQVFFASMPRSQPLYNEEPMVHTNARKNPHPLIEKSEEPTTLSPKHTIRTCKACHKSVSKPKFRCKGRCNQFYCSHCVLCLNKGRCLLTGN